MIFDELPILLNSIKNIKAKLEYSNKKNQLHQITTEMNRIDYSNLSKNDIELIKKQEILDKICCKIDNLDRDLHDIQGLLEISTQEDVIDIFNATKKAIQELETIALFDKEEDICDCFIELIAGTGGLDSQDCVDILMKMYLGYAKNKNFSVTIEDIDKTEAGIRSVNLLLKGEYAYGLLKRETGTHRIVRISPFNANDKRQTSFVNVFCFPKTNKQIDIQINPKDLKIDTYRSSGAGGQHVNTTDSAIRITHIPTNTVVQCQEQRSQIANREKAMEMLKYKLTALELEKQNQEKMFLEDNKSDATFGNQIRNYVFQPYKLIKDLRINYQINNIDKFLSGDMDELIFELIKNLK